MTDTHTSAGTRKRRGVLDLPEFNVVLFAFLLNYPWEFLQVPLFLGMPTADHWEAIVFCSRAAGGDALIALFGFWVVGAIWRNRDWIVRPRSGQVLAFVVVGILVTIGFEWHATVIAQRWEYSPLMPVVPVIGTGLSPLLQWTILPPLIVWLVRRQIAGSDG